VSARAIATASEAQVAEAASALLSRGNAVDAVVAGVFAAAAASPSVLLGPVQILLGGAGLGLRAIDGRTQQPGRGVARPRGFTPSDVVPGAARFAVPALPAALAAALATSGASTLAQVMAPAIAIASEARKAVLKRIAQRGPAALVDDPIASELVAAGGRLAGGVLTKEDLDALRPAVVACNLHALAAGRRASIAPWRVAGILGDGDGAPIDASRARVVAVADAKGLLAIACYEVHDDGVDVPELGLRAPFTAEPVLRGQTRVRPGEPRPAAAPIALAEHEGVLDVALAITGVTTAERALGDLLTRLSGEALEASHAPVGGGTVIGVVRSRAGARLLRAAGTE
jgi:hypothetical protein